MLERLRAILSHTYELDNVLAFCAKPSVEPSISECESNIGQVLLIKFGFSFFQVQKLRRTLDVVPSLRSCLAKVKSELLKGMKDVHPLF